MHPFFYDNCLTQTIDRTVARVARDLSLLTLAVVSAFVAPSAYCQDRMDQYKFAMGQTGKAFNSHALQYSMRDHHYQQIAHDQHEVGFQKNYQGSAAARKMVQLALKGAWMTYKDHAVTYFVNREEPELEAVPERSSLEAGLLLLKDSFSYRVRVSSSKLHLNVRYDF